MRGRREDRVRAAPAVSCATVCNEHAHEHTGPAETLRRYGIPLGAKATVRIQSGEIGCWKCGVVTRIVTFIEVFVGPHSFRLTVPDLNDFPDLLASCKERIPKASGIRVIKPRYSRTQDRSYMSNGCFDCDALIGEFFEDDAWDDEKATLAEFQIPISERWVKAIETTYGTDTYGWGVFAFE
jgi:hypothetical protein